jgi:hypothetical protein
MVLEFIQGNKIDREKWDRRIDSAVNGNICAYSWFLDILCSGWDGLVAADYTFIMPIPVVKRFGISYLLQPRFIQQLGIFGALVPEAAVVSQFIAAFLKEVRVVDYHFNDQNNLPTGYTTEMRANFLLNLDRSYDSLRVAYAQNLIRKLNRSAHSGFHIIKNNNPEPLIKLFREVNSTKFSFIKNENWQRLSRVIHACINRNKAEVWSVYNRENKLCGGVVWLFSHNKAVLYFSAQSKAGRAEGALAWLIDAFIREKASSGIVLDFEGSVQPGLARFYGSFGSVVHSYPRLILNNLSPFLKLAYQIYKKVKKV